MRNRQSSCVAVLAHFMFIPEVLASWWFQFDSPVSSVLLFPLKCQTGPSRDKGVLLLWFHPRVWWLCVCSWLKANGRHHSSIVPLSVESYNLLVTSTIEMAVVYRSDPLCRCLQESPSRADSGVRLCACSGMSSRVDCLGLCSSQRVISGTPWCVLWSSTWILMGRRRCCWERTARWCTFILLTSSDYQGSCPTWWWWW